MPTKPCSVTQRSSSSAAACGLDHRELGHELDAVGRVRAELGARVVQRAAQRDGEVAVVQRELLAGAGWEQHRGVDALEVHVGEARLGVVHARAHRRRRAELEVVVGPGGGRGVVVVHLHAAAGHVAPGDPVVVLQRAHVLDHLRAEPVGNAPPPVERLAAVPVGVDHLEPVATHASVTRRPVDHVAQVVAARRNGRGCRRRARTASPGSGPATSTSAGRCRCSARPTADRREGAVRRG